MCTFVYSLYFHVLILFDYFYVFFCVNFVLKKKKPYNNWFFDFSTLSTVWTDIINPDIVYLFRRHHHDLLRSINMHPDTSTYYYHIKLSAISVVIIY